VIEMSIAGRVRGVIQLAGGRIPAELDVSVDSAGVEAAIANYADGRFWTGALAPGKYEFVVQGKRIKSVRRAVDVEAGRTSQLGLTLEPAALRTLRFLLPKGMPRPRALSINLRNAKGELAWVGGLGPEGPLEIEISLPSGTYRLNGYGEGKTLLKETLTVEGLRDLTTVLEYSLAVL